MTDAERRILKNQQIMMDALHYILIMCDARLPGNKGTMDQKAALYRACVKTEILLKQAGEDTA